MMVGDCRNKKKTDRRERKEQIAGSEKNRSPEAERIDCRKRKKQIAGSEKNSLPEVKIRIDKGIIFDKI